MGTTGLYGTAHIQSHTPHHYIVLVSLSLALHTHSLIYPVSFMHTHKDNEVPTVCSLLHILAVRITAEGQPIVVNLVRPVRPVVAAMAMTIGE